VLKKARAKPPRHKSYSRKNLVKILPEVQNISGRIPMIPPFSVEPLL
jgi:hypothetical protein